jgi:dephospho-CoA kinase
VTSLKIGLTGGIGSGKTAASDRFAARGAEVIDTDILSRELVEPGQPALDEIQKAFGTGILTPDGRLDRGALRRLIFDNPAMRSKLEDILHPRIRAEMLRRAADSSAPYVVFVIPLLIEAGQQALVDRILLIDVPETLQKRRVADRDGSDKQHIEQILAAQTDRQTRLQYADDVIRNDGSLADLEAQVDALHDSYLRLAKRSKN